MSLLDFNPQKQRNNVYLCGFLPNRLHNEQLYSISRELMLPFFVCTNPTSYQKWNKKETANLMNQCDVMVFWLNRYTLNDRNCLLSLQMAWELNLQVVMLRHPRMRLVVNPVIGQGKEQSEMDEVTAPNMSFLQYAILDGYKQSIEYDRNSHALSIQRLISKILSVLESKYANSTRESTPTSASSDTYPDTKEFLKLPNLSSMYSFNETDHRRASTISHIMARSRSHDNVKGRPSLVQIPVPLVNGFSHKLNGKVKRRDSSLPRIITLKKSRTFSSEDFPQKLNGLGVPEVNRNFLASSPDIRRDSCSAALRSTNDPELYHSTQYLVFPMTDKSHKPRLIHFPMDIINSKNRDDLELESAWGSDDSSLAEDADMANKLQGDLLISSPPPTPAPYIDPL